MPLFSLFGGADRLRACVQESRAALFRLAYMWCHDRALADDLTQEALAKALAHATQLRDPAKLRPWLCGILSNCWRDHLRALRPMDDIDAIEEHHLASEVGMPDQTLGRTQLALRVRAAVAQLPVGQRTVLSLVDLEGLTYAEVAQAMDIPIGTVMSRLCRARAALREMLAEGAQARPALRSVK